jgi:hypothetical protein
LKEGLIKEAQFLLSFNAKESRMSIALFYDINQWLLFFILLIIYFLSIFFGFQLGMKHQILDIKKRAFLIFNLQVAILGLLAILLGFTFALAAFRYEIRKDLIVEESNAIYTAYLRTKLLPDPIQKDVLGLLQRYLRLRSEDLSTEYDAKKLQRFEQETEKIQLLMWDKVAGVAKNNSQANTITLFLESLNRMIDLYTNREMAMANHIPETILLLLFLTSSLALLLTGYSLGLEKSRDFMPTLVLAFLILVVTIVIIDLDRPRSGLIRVNVSNISNLRDFALRPY